LPGHLLLLRVPASVSQRPLRAGNAQPTAPSDRWALAAFELQQRAATIGAGKGGVLKEINLTHLESCERVLVGAAMATLATMVKQA
jgi:hypothetical protein